jgi:DNA-binding winged helix-turn-helix (wHTH) protein
MQNGPPTAYLFEGFRLDLARRRLADTDGRALPLSARAYDVLAFLVENRARVVSKDELMRAVWSRVIVEENNLNQAIYNIRKALGDSRETPRFIVTVAGRGYQFIADTRPAPGDAPAQAATTAETPASLEPTTPSPVTAEATASDLAHAPVAGPVPAMPPARHSRRWLLAAGGAALAGLAGAA